MTREVPLEVTQVAEYLHKAFDGKIPEAVFGVASDCQILRSAVLADLAGGAPASALSA